MLSSDPGGVQQELVVQDLPDDKSRKFPNYGKHFRLFFSFFFPLLMDVSKNQLFINEVKWLFFSATRIVNDIFVFLTLTKHAFIRI
ncbi:hypothetical protein JCM15548_11745 [Geofilum rubicundum JCM 15548]|uniref:Uncharacterized protein n=1 Tax=Geofilum rubicundum JCM 15548 TaxID=1236989 RepID=A0A0E9LWQ1_9BACT|nr:hypothetical protein JCM15548_11745 [Geofilum rubicundum JCM 15548]